ncbi:hypothetical protein ACHAWF_008215 [Thalassiosira exigua]
MDYHLLATCANLVLQVHRSHLERMERFLKVYRDDEGRGDVEILLTLKSTASKSCSLVLLRATDGKAFVERLVVRHGFILQGLNKIYAITNERSIMRGSLAPVEESGSSTAMADVAFTSKYLLKTLQKLQRDASRAAQDGRSTAPPRKIPVAAKVEVFPAKLQRGVVSGLAALLDAKSIPVRELDVSPAGQTHTLSVIQIDSDAFLVGVAPAELSPPVVDRVHASTDVCRAERKLSEAFERYRCDNTRSEVDDGYHPFSAAGPTPKRSGDPLIAVDCGAAPGGWTKFLAERTSCDEVYAIDPGELDESVSSLPNVQHMKMTAKEAMPKLREDLTRRNDKVGLWVSDMCVHDIPKQVDTFLMAYQKGVFQPRAGFVLTIKCNVGHASWRFDSWAKEQADRLARDVGAYDVSIMHLFSNRIGERTVVGRVK